ncbi:MAG: hypothetical protein GF383_12965 [Candidatus Lokiarchaeota archaeon]|nr:hypothetical protein [Candidatus Lokiarchaeota archaeon]MBD3342018.1 hypothetical protein [Candidatus Lokiarchaeota archaeon]
MNKYTVLSILLTFFLIFSTYLPLGIHYTEDTNNPLMIDSYVKVFMYLVNYKGSEVYIWGMIPREYGWFYFWVEFHLLTFIFLGVLTTVAGVLTVVGLVLETEIGKKLMGYAVVAKIFVIAYIIFGLTIYSKELFGRQFYFDIFLYLGFGSYILIVDVIIAGFGYYKHSVF